MKEGNRVYGPVNMMAGYFSDWIHTSAILALEELNLSKDIRILDIGAGQGAFSQRLLDHGYTNITAIEAFAPFDVPEVTLHKFDLNYAWELEDTFDLIIGIEIIEHVENAWHFLRESKKLSHRNTKLILTTPNPLNFVDRLQFLFTGQLVMMNHEDHRTPIFPQLLERACKETGWDIQNHRIDLDILKAPSHTSLGRLKKAGAKILRSIIDGKEVKPYSGNSNIWNLTPNSHSSFQTEKLETNLQLQS